ncbi:MAG TPA: glycosyltransferase family 4 protein [Planctomycetota bacterium]|nr:glycosyltransferase family 4 protein [Planctomycetota bacterium]
MSGPRVLVLTHSLSEVDGVGRYGVGLLRELAPLCSGIEVYIGRRHRGLAPDLPSRGVTVHETLPTDHFPFLSLPKLAWLLLLSLPELWRAARRADLVHSFSDYPMGFVAVLVARLASRPAVVSGHGTYSVTPLDMPVHRRLIRWMFARTDRFLTGSRYALSVVGARVRPRGAEVVWYGVTPSDYDAAAARGRLPGVPRPYVLCVGEVKQRKGYATSLPAFLRAWSQEPALHYAIVGRYAADDRYYQELLRQVEQAGAQGHVHFLGNVDEPRKVALMRGCAAFMLTPTVSDEGGFEAYGLVFLEAGAAGRPVLGVRGSGAEDAIADGENGCLREPGDVAGLADALLSLVRDPQRAARMGAAGRARAERQTWRAAAARVAAVYGELLGGPAARPPGGPAP